MLEVRIFQHSNLFPQFNTQRKFEIFFGSNIPTEASTIPQKTNSKIIPRGGDT